MSATAEQRAAAEQALGELERARLAAWTQVYTTWAADDSSKAAAVSFLQFQVPQSLDSLRRQLELIDSPARWARWVDDATELRNSITTVVGYTDEWSMRGVLLATAGATAGELGSAAQAAVKGSGTGAAFFTFAALGFVAWKVLQ